MQGRIKKEAKKKTRGKHSEQTSIKLSKAYMSLRTNGEEEGKMKSMVVGLSMLSQ